MNIIVLGAGSWGTALACLLCQNGHDVTLQSWMPQQIEEMRADGENKQFLPGKKLPPGLKLTTEMSAVADAELVLFAVPSPALPDVAAQARPYLRPGVVLINVAKGFEQGGTRRLSQLLQQACPGHPCVALSGPSHAEEVAMEHPTLVAVSGAPLPVLQAVQEAFSNSYFRVYTNSDLIGVEVGGAMKNVIALCAGILDGLGMGDNAKAALMTRGLAEMTRLGLAMGAKSATFAGLTGVGDLIVTCTSRHSRNYRAGVRIGQGIPCQQVIEEMGMVVEGAYATECVHQLSRLYQVDTPISDKCYQVLYEGEDPRSAMMELMRRTYRSEEE
ncbi:MAG: NAD(P)H-dependent glycerol-3-phosphate dehydrogenase [Firmicutes bacterium]|nr:NAD(P)H-dependent glycerol-3-phosphate dehydrogenase [Bacillota bacterium]